MFKNLGLADLPAEKHVVVTQGYESNLPAISLKVYGTMNHWEVLLWANSLNDPLNIPVGTVLKVPSLTKVKAMREAKGRLNGLT